MTSIEQSGKTPSRPAPSAAAPARPSSLDMNGILKLLPHRYPMLMVDRLEQIVPHVSAVGLKNVTGNENFFQGHFPGAPVMPGVMIVEAMVQTAGALVLFSMDDPSRTLVSYFLSMDNVRFRKQVKPGDQLRLHVRSTHNRGSVWKFHGEARVDGVLVSEADCMAMIADLPSSSAPGAQVRT